MATIADYFEQAQLSMAAYAQDLQPGMFGGGEGSPYHTALIGAGMSSIQATRFANSYSVVDQYTDFVSGFSGTVFADQAGNKYVAIRGSEPGPFTGPQDWLLTNAGDIGNDGIAIYQGIALFNWLQRLYGSPGQPVVQSESTNEGVYDAHVKEPITDALAIYSWVGVSAANPKVPGGRWPRALGFAALTPTYQ